MTSLIHITNAVNLLYNLESIGWHIIFQIPSFLNSPLCCNLDLKWVLSTLNVGLISHMTLASICKIFGCSLSKCAFYIFKQQYNFTLTVDNIFNDIKLSYYLLFTYFILIVNITKCLVSVIKKRFKNLGFLSS